MEKVEVYFISHQKERSGVVMKTIEGENLGIYSSEYSLVIKDSAKVLFSGPVSQFFAIAVK